MQPGLEYAQSFGCTDGKHFDTAVGEVDGMAGNTESLGFPARALAKPDALDTAVNREQPCFGIHRINRWTRTTRWP